MIFYLTIKSNKILTHVPHIDSIYINLNGESKCCTWDETDADVNGLFICYRFKGVYFNDECIDIDEETTSISVEEINWKEDDNAEEFKVEFLNLTIHGVYIKDISVNYEEINK